MVNEIKTPSNPSKRAIKRVKNPLPKPEVCNLCGGHVLIKSHTEIYGRNYGDWPWVYGCVSCGAYVGLHPFTDIPLGTLADKETREARNKCKAPFEIIHKHGYLSRNDAYQALSEKLGIDKKDCHFGWFDIEMCEKAFVAAKEILEGLNNG